MSELRKANTDFPYFLTITLVDWIDLFTRKTYCDLIVSSLKHCIEHKGLIVFEFVIMPSHLHMIAQSLDSQLNHIMRDFKSFTAKSIVQQIIQDSRQESRREWLLASFRKHARRYKQNQEYMVWQKKMHPIQVGYESIQKQKAQYIHNNPVAAGLVTDGSYWTYSSANPDSPLETSRL